MDWKNPEEQRLLQAIMSLKMTAEAERFLRDLLTAGEISELSKRFRAAEMLDAKTPYSFIEQETGFSSTTVARVAKWLNSGRGGYKLIIDRLHHTDPDRPREGSVAGNKPRTAVLPRPVGVSMMKTIDD